MAARNDQTFVYQIALVFFVIASMILGGLLAYVNNLRDTHLQQVKSLRTEKSNEENTARKYQSENEWLRTSMGFAALDDFSKVQGQFEEDKKTYMGSYPESDRAYRVVLSRLDTEVKRSTDQESQAKAREKELKERLQVIEKEKEAQIKEFQETLKQVEADAASERNKFNDARTDLKEKEKKALDTLARQRQSHEKEVAELNAKIADLDSQLVKIVKSRDKLLEERERGEPSFEISDGRIAWVNQANGTVWINLGEGDSLRRQVTFSVYEQSASDAGKADKKAAIEVTRMLGEHMAEARITQDDARNPILPGDWIYSPTWHRGKQIRFALTGVLDLDGDGRADLQQAKDLIALNDGKIDSTVTDAGTVEGEMTVETRYLVLGDFPSLPSQAELRTSWDTMSREAKNLGVETITLQEFLNQMGYKPLDRTVTVGDGARAADFLPEKGRFRPRSPYGSR